MKRLTLFAIASMAFLAACASPIQKFDILPLTGAQTASIKSVVAYNLRDPDSAQFRRIRYIRAYREDGTSDAFVCGEVNGKNAFGGYAGFQIFKGVLIGNQFTLRGISNDDNRWVAEANCPG